MRAPESIEDVIANPTEFGMPTFDDFRKNKEKYLGRKDDVIASVDRGDTNLRCPQEYWIGGYKIKTLEQGERIAREMGHDFYTEFEPKPQVMPDNTARGYYIRVNFVRKKTV